MTLPQSPYKRGADRGFIFGIYLSAMFLMSVSGAKIPLFGLISLLMVIAVPFVIYRFLRRTYVQEQHTTPLSSLWMQGIVIFACGALIHSIVALVYLKWVNPGFIMEQMENVISIYQQAGSASAEKFADTLQRIIDAGAVPSPTAIVVEMVWLAIFSGSLLSLLMGLLARAAGTSSRHDIPHRST